MISFRAFAGLIAIGGVALLGSATPSFAGPDVSSNGSFSSCTSTCVTGQLSYPAGGSYSAFAGVNISGWMNTSTYAYLVTSSAFAPTSGTITLPNANNGAGTISMWKFPSASPDGGNFIIEDSDYNINTGPDSNNGGVSQNISGLNIGSTYQVGFYEAAAQQTGFSGSTTDQWAVTLGGTTQNSTLLSIPYQGFSGWTYVSLSFVATAAAEVLSFAALGTGSPPFLALDGVTVTVPEPATYALLAVGLLGLVMVRRTSNRRG